MPVWGIRLESSTAGTTHVFLIKGMLTIPPSLK